jgi:hypothetical protein
VTGFKVRSKNAKEESNLAVLIEEADAAATATILLQ